MDNTTETLSAPENMMTQSPTIKKIERNRKFVIVGAILTLLAWITMPIWDWLSVFFVITGLVFSAIGCRIPPGPRRNLAITATIAASALLLAIVVIWVVLQIFI